MEYSNIDLRIGESGFKNGEEIRLRIILLLALLLTASTINADITQGNDQNNIQACVLYGTDKQLGFPIVKQKCAEVRISINCNEAVVDSQNINKIWRGYPKLNCSDPNIRAGLSELYLVEGID